MINDKKHEMSVMAELISIHRRLRRRQTIAKAMKEKVRARENVRQLAESDVRFEEQMALWTVAAGGDRSAALRGIPVANLRLALRIALVDNFLRPGVPEEAAFDAILGYLHR